MLLLESLPTVIGAAAIAPALLVLWLVIAADERPGPPARVWVAFLLGAASISLLGVARAPFNALLAIPGNPWMTQALRSLFGVAAPEEIVKVLVIVAVSARRHVAIAGRLAQRADRAVPRCARYHRRRVSRHRARWHRARRAPAPPRLGSHLEPNSGVVRADRAACRFRFSAADAA